MRSLEEASEGWNRATEKRLALLAQDLRKLTESQSAAAASTEGLRIFTETWEHVSEEAKGQATILAILTSLRFAQIKERQSEIPKAHRRTFEWVFSDNSCVDFSTWLRESSGLFWITGKPGSGKSTLMKFILGHEQTMLLSEHWAGSKPLIVASHFFWSAGTTIQKSQEGLLRTLLFQILVNYPEIIPAVCPLRYSNPFKRLESWSIEELSQVFGRLQNIQPLSSRILLLIDGLDEYNGNLGDLVQFLRSTSESPYIKSQEIEASKLVKDIAEKSEGVFFWVSLVVKSLLRGLDNSDDLDILQQRLSEFPSDLDQFFQRMLDTIDQVYKDNASMVFSILLLANSSSPLVLFVELEKLIAMLNIAESRKERSSPLASWRQDPDNDSQLTFLLTLLSEEARGFSTDMEHYQASHKDFSIIQVNRRRYQILAQCRDLVQAWEVSGDYGPKYNWRLGFLHRTVVEFLERASENQWQSAIPFKRYLLARSYLGFIAVGDRFQNRTREFVLRFLYTLQGADLKEITEFFPLTDELFEGLLRFLGSETSSLDPYETEEMKLLLTQARGRISAAVGEKAKLFFQLSNDTPYYFLPSMRSLPWCLRESGYVEIGDWTQVCWSRFVDLETLEVLLGKHLAAYNMHRNYPAAFSTFLVRLSTDEATRPQNAFLVCKALVEHGFAGLVEHNAQDMPKGLNPVQILYEGTMDSALTQSSTIE
ncbi:small S protein [Colletotrichum tofieldiae]|nr:small S protein [Colletotrichum tofieldiae]